MLPKNKKMFLTNHSTAIKFSKFSIEIIVYLTVCTPILLIDPIMSIGYFSLVEDLF